MLLYAALAASTAWGGEGPPPDFDGWVLFRVQESARKELRDAVRVAAGATSASDQQETPAGAGNPTTLIDTSSASDFISVALNLAGLTGSSDSDATDVTSATATATGYAFYAAALGVDPLGREHYCDTGAQWLRRLSGTIGFDDGDDEDERSVLAGAKLVIPFIDRRNVCDPDAFDDLDADLAAAAAADAALVDEVSDALFAAIQESDASNPRDPRVSAAVVLGEERFRSCLSGNHYLDDRDELQSCGQGDENAFFQWVQSAVGGSALDGIIAEHATEAIEIESRLQKTIAAAMRQFEMQPRFAAEFTTRQGDELADEYAVTGIVDFGLFRPGLKGVLNFAWEQLDPRDGDTSNGGSVALSVQYEFPRGDPGPTRPPRVSLTGEGKWMEDMGDIYRGQLQLAIPVPFATGVEVPISMTVANRTEFIDETEVRGVVGFSLDTARLFHALVGDGGAFALLGEGTGR